MSVINKFYPSEEILNSLSYRDQKKVSVLLKGDLICFIMFAVFATALIALGRATGFMMIGTCLFFLFSMIEVKRGKLVFGSYVTTIGLCMACCVIAFFTSFVHHPVVSYRTICFCVTIGVLNYMVSLKRGQVLLLMIFSIILLIASTFILHYPQDFMQDPKEWLAGVVINIIAVIAANLILLASTKSNDEIVKHSEDEHKQVSDTLNKITIVLHDVKEALNIGQQLNVAANKVSSSVNSITNVYEELIKETSNLTNQVSIIQSSSGIVNESSAVMANGIDKQNTSLTEVSNAITQISANISNIDSIAAKRREGMAKITDLLTTQNNLINKLLVDVNKVQESSQHIEEFVATVDTIAQQTNLLAMNASIEAAHAGESGKGFSVIAQEIRKLSEETTKNAASISDTLQANSVVVGETTESVTTFADALKQSAKEISDTLGSIEDILQGVTDIDSETKEIMESIKKIVAIAGDNSEVINEVVNQISSQNDGIESITNGANLLKQKIESISGMLTMITDATLDVHNTAERNEEVSARIAEVLQ